MRPETGDYNSYYGRYVSLIETDDIINVLKTQLKTTLSLLNAISEDQGDYSYAEGKWTIKELLGHVIDTERIMTYRALSFARNEKQPQPGFEQDDYVFEANFNSRKITDMVEEFRLVREANIMLFSSWNENEFQRKGIASDNKITVLALIYIIAGHEKHHMKILKERYLRKNN